MKLTVMCAGYAAPHAGWVAIDELAQLFAHYFDAEILSPRRLPATWSRRLLQREDPRWSRLDADGGDVLLVVAHGPEDLSMIDAIPHCRRRYARIHAWVTDSYFQAGFGRATASYDAITVTAHEDVAHPRERYGIAVHPLYQGADCLTWAPRVEAARDIDLVGFGRMPPSYHALFLKRFHAPESRYLYLHSPLGNLTGPTVHLERGMLFKILQRTKVSLAFHLYVEPQGDRPRSMMVTSRWLESLLAGCIVAGRRPVSRMAEDMLCWPGATVELAEDPGAAVEQLQALLAARDDVAARRRRNVREMLLRHDWRHRMVEMCRLFGLPVPRALASDLDSIQELAASYA